MTQRLPVLQRTLVIMVKLPVAGRVKTRLARGIGSSLATSFHRCTISNLVARLTAPRRWRLLLAVTPDRARNTPALPGPRPARVVQGTGDLGCRLQHVFDHAPPGPVIVIGSDVPGISQRDIAEAFHRLDGHDAVVGPSPDGGYWLIGLRRRPRRLQPFVNVRWSTDAALAGTLANLAGIQVARVGEKADIDDAAGWRSISAIRGRRIVGPTART